MRQILERTDRYNQDAARNRDANAPSTSIVEDVREPAPAVKQAQEAVKTLSIADGVYRAANYTSMSFANKVRASDAIVYFLALFAVAAFNLVSNNRARALALSWRHPGDADPDRPHPVIFGR